MAEWIFNGKASGRTLARMTALATLLVIAAFAYLVHRFGPRRPSDGFRLDRFRAPGPLTEWSPSYYENQRQYADLTAIYGRGDVPDPDVAARAHPERAGQRRISNPGCGAVKSTVGGAKASSGKLDWSARSCRTRSAH
ncbi:hypothetical protein [Nocardia sp. NPDC049707]|uniref:hypothetical protein n=1 Tax=Nocardia sp. NPDC049707 TaxID=3154735 RepID=UPI00343BF92B